MSATATLPARRVENGTAMTAGTHAANPNTLQALLESQKEKLALVLPKHMTAEKLIKVALVAVSKTPMLQQCTPITVLQSLMTAAQLGLECGGALGHSYLVPFKKNWKDEQGRWQNEVQCQLIIGYRGLIDLARRSGEIVNIEARVVWQNDEFDIQYTLEGVKLKHVPALDKDPGELRLVYAFANFKGGGMQFELMTRAQIDAIRSRSKAKDTGPWVTDYPEMARKTVVKRLAKYLPLSVEVVDTVEKDTQTEFGQSIDFTQTRALPSANDLNKRLAAPDFVSDTSVGQQTDHINTETGEITEAEAQSATAEPPAEAEPEDLSDHGKFRQLCQLAASDQGMGPEDFDKAFAALGVSTKIKSVRRSEWKPARARVLAAFRAGVVGVDGTIPE